MDEEERKGTSMRDFRRDSDRKFLYLVLFTLVIVGGLLIGVIFGLETLLTALPCLIGGAAIIFIPWLILEGLQRWRDKSEIE